MTTSINPFSPEFQADPYPFYRQLRETDPVHKLEILGLGIWVLTRYDDVAAALRDQRLSAAAVPRDLLPRELADGNMFYKDPPDHTRLRNLVNKAYTPQVIEGLRARAQSIVDDLLGAARQRGRMDAIADLAVPLSITLSAEILGVPPGDQQRLKGWSDDLAVLLDGTRMMAGLARAQVAAAAFIDYLREAIAQRRRRPAADLLSALIAAREREDRLSEDELIATSLFTFVAGHETVTGLIGNGLLALHRHPAALAGLVRDQQRIGAATEEILRYDPPIQLTTRMAREDLDLGGRHIAAGEPVCAVLAAANRDPARFADPDVLDVDRPGQDSRHLSFGLGPHYCVGAALARLEFQTALSLLLTRHPGLVIEAEGAVRRPGVLLRGLLQLPVRL